MKVLLLTTLLASASMASAEDFDNNEYTVTVGVENFEFSATDGETGTLGAGVYVLPRTYGNVDTNIFLSLEYDLDLEETTVAAEYNASSNLSPDVAVYGSVELAYNTADYTTLTPTAGISLSAAPNLDFYGQIDYTMDVENDFTGTESIAEVGAIVGLSDTLAIRPAVFTDVKNSDDVNAKLELLVNF